jgi:hypothetical protein
MTDDKIIESQISEIRNGKGREYHVMKCHSPITADDITNGTRPKLRRDQERHFGPVAQNLDQRKSRVREGHQFQTRHGHGTGLKTDYRTNEGRNIRG